jgi:hypothetical protein
MFNFIQKKSNILTLFIKRFNTTADFNHYRDTRLLDKYATDIASNKYYNMKFSKDINTTISNSLIFSYKDYRNHILQEFHKKK